ncbi:MAG: asparagine synthase (glutamine-hydrolyzing) [Planctomycetes bacterium]|nr:asparagine synthase (glutamine-hydrolyzing) [Planctomycetota bacterium]
MCGIFGHAGTRERPAAELVACRDTLAHRGPDDAGAWIVSSGDWTAWLGHRRLSILDLSSAGRQPFVSPDGRVAVAANGEFYNWRELRREQEMRGARFSSNSDSEVLLWGFLQEGTAFFARLIGIFAAAVVDAREAGQPPRIYLVRDPAGVKPLYWWSAAGEFAFASELKALAALPGFSRKIDRGALDHYLVLGYVPAPLSIYEGCWKLPAGSFLEWRGGEARVEVYWRPDPRETGTFQGSEAEALEELESMLAAAIEAERMSDVPLGAFLSGGIDSSTVCALAQGRMSDRLRTFTIGFDFAAYDESAGARRVAEYLGTEHTSVTMTERDLLAIVPRTPALFDEPFADPSALPTYLLSKITRSSVLVALSGDGGDELFFGYTRYPKNLRLALADRIPAPLRRAAGGLLAALFGHTFPGKAGKALAYDGFDEAMLLHAGIFHRAYFDRLTGRPFRLAGSPLRERYRALESLPRAMRGPLLDLSFYLPEDVLTKVDRASMAHALEVRVPLLERPLVEFANRLPLSFKYRGGVQKYLLKKILSKHVPRELWDRPKQGFGIPLDRWFLGELQGLVDEFLSPDRLRRDGVFSPEYVAELRKEHEAEAKDNQYYLWTLLVFQMWREETGAELPESMR